MTRDKMKITVMIIFMTGLAALSHAHTGSHTDKAKFTKHFNDTLFGITEKGLLSIELLLDDKEYNIGKDAIGIVVHDSHDEDIEHAKLQVTVSGSEGYLIVTEKGGGLYLVSSGSLPKMGIWELKISINKGRLDDRISFSFPGVLERKISAGQYTPENLRGKR